MRKNGFSTSCLLHNEKKDRSQTGRFPDSNQNETGQQPMSQVVLASSLLEAFGHYNVTTNLVLNV